jgi:hypothetical protein
MSETGRQNTFGCVWRLSSQFHQRGDFSCSLVENKASLMEVHSSLVIFVAMNEQASREIDDLSVEQSMTLVSDLDWHLDICSSSISLSLSRDGLTHFVVDRCISMFREDFLPSVFSSLEERESLWLVEDRDTDRYLFDHAA